MEYLTVPQLKARVRTDLDDTALADIIAEESALIDAALGKPPASPMVEEFVEPGPVLWLAYRPDGVTEVRDPGQDVVIDPGTYVVDGRAVIRTKAASDWSTDLDVASDRPNWPTRVRVTYAIADSPAVLALLRGVCLDLCRLALTDMGAEQSERLGDYQHESKDVQAERRRVLARLNRIKGMRPVMAR